MNSRKEKIEGREGMKNNPKISKIWLYFCFDISNPNNNSSFVFSCSDLDDSAFCNYLKVLENKKNHPFEKIKIHFG